MPSVARQIYDLEREIAYLIPSEREHRLSLKLAALEGRDIGPYVCGLCGMKSNDEYDARHCCDDVRAHDRAMRKFPQYAQPMPRESRKGQEITDMALAILARRRLARMAGGGG